VTQLEESGLAQYLDRIGHGGAATPSLEVLTSVHVGHLGRIPFENIDVRLGRAIGLDLESLRAKLVGRRRGGYCFEQNSLFAAALRALGFEVATLEARVRPPGATSTLPRTHMTLEVAVDGRAWLADVGFGGDGPLTPVPMDGEVSEQGDDAYRVECESAHTLVLRRRWQDSWTDLYAFSPTPALPVDFEVANHFTSTYPTSIFRRTLTVQRSEPAARRILRNRTYTIRRSGAETQREIADGELPLLLTEEFGIELTVDEKEAIDAIR